QQHMQSPTCDNMQTAATHHPSTNSALAFSPPATISAFLDALWLEDGLAQNTLSAYRPDLTAFAQWLHAKMHKALEHADAADIQDWFAAKHPHSKASTANRRLASLRRYYLWALRQGVIHNDPCLTLRAAKQAERFPKTLSEDQVDALLQAPDT